MLHHGRGQHGREWVINESEEIAEADPRSAHSHIGSGRLVVQPWLAEVEAKLDELIAEQWCKASLGA